MQKTTLHPRFLIYADHIVIFDSNSFSPFLHSFAFFCFYCFLASTLLPYLPFTDRDYKELNLKAERGRIELASAIRRFSQVK